MIREFLGTCWIWFALAMLCVMTYSRIPWITPLVVGATAGFLAGKHHEATQPPRFHS